MPNLISTLLFPSNIHQSGILICLFFSDHDGDNDSDSADYSVSNDLDS